MPPHLPGGGGWGIKVFSLGALYSEHEYARNTWTRTNRDLALCRYQGTKIRLYQSKDIDYIFSWTNQLPMQSTLGLYNAMQPSIHFLQQNRVVVPSLDTYKKKKPYFKIFIPPPAPLQNKWYFQQDLAKIPLFLTRTSATSLTQFYINQESISTNITITSLNTGLIQNRQFKELETSGYWAYMKGSDKVYLYADREYTDSQRPKAKNLIPLFDTLNYYEGKAYSDVYHDNSHWTEWKTKWSQYRGNPFHADYLSGDIPIYQSTLQYPTILNTKQPDDYLDGFSIVSMTKTLRYNPYADQTHDHQCYFKPNHKSETGWKAPENEDLTNEGLPFWLLCWGFADWHRKIKKQQHLDTDYIFTINNHVNLLIKDYIVPLSDSFLQGTSPYYELGKRSPTDAKTWYPQLQYQTEAINAICACGPGTPKIPDNYSVQAIMTYTSYFKWGGHPPPMSTIENPKELPTFNLPGTKYGTNSLQNPTTDPERLLWSFDERRNTITKRAIKRLQKDEQTKKAFITDGNPFQDQPQTQETSETSSEEEETETLFEQLQQQRLKQRKLKQRILLTIQKIQQLE